MEHHQRRFGTIFSKIDHFKISPRGDFGDFWRFLVATFIKFIRMQLVIPIFHTKFDPLQVSVVHFDYIPPIGDFGDFWLLLFTLVSKPLGSLKDMQASRNCNNFWSKPFNSFTEMQVQRKKNNNEISAYQSLHFRRDTLRSQGRGNILNIP